MERQHVGAARTWRGLPHLVWFGRMNTFRRRSRTGSRLVGASRMMVMVVQCDVHCVAGYAAAQPESTVGEAVRRPGWRA
ncbi:hypothetical protein [Hyphomonas sp.]|uniref:hypothetical protein n=1 Tax=Hyphomonas sp. TaxID=87 RepID=UPI0032987569